jgi:predicted thioesterase
VEAEATLDKVEGRRLVFTVTAADEAGLVGAGRMTRVVVEVEGFLAKAR